jgi:hypothetical protein
LNLLSRARAEWRVLISAALVGSGLGLSLGALYLAGGLARAVTEHSRATQTAQATDVVLSAGYEPVLSSTSTPPPLRFASRRTAARELDCLTQAVYFEARGEPARGQVAVATVVLNRVRSPAFPKTVCGVVYQGVASRGCQFSFACDGSMNRGREAGAWDRARLVATRALSGVVLADIGSATHFHTTGVSPGWGPQMLRVAQVGLHVFYRFNPHARIVRPEEDRAVFVSAPAPTTELRLAKAVLETTSDVSTNAIAVSSQAAEPKVAAPQADMALKSDPAPLAATMTDATNS